MHIKTIIRIPNISTDSANPHPFAKRALLRSAAVCGEAATVFSRQIPHNCIKDQAMQKIKRKPAHITQAFAKAVNFGYPFVRACGDAAVYMFSPFLEYPDT